MKLFDILKKTISPRLKYAKTMSLYSPHYTSYYNTDIYESDVVKQAIRCIIQEMKKLEPRHVVRIEGRNEPCNDSIQWTLDDPNELMTTADFLEKVVYNLLVTNNSYVLPVWELGELVALYPLCPEDVKFVQDANDTMFIEFIFSSGYTTRIRYSDVIHIRYNFGPSEFLGGDISGKPDIRAIQRGVNLNEDLLSSVQKSIKASAVNGFLKYNSVIDDGETEKKLKDFVERLNNNESGIMLIDNKNEFIPYNRDVKLVDEATLKFADEKVLRNYGISQNIITGNYTKEQYETFFQKVLEPIIVTINQGFTKSLFTREGRTKLGHKIIFYTSLMNFMTMNERKEIGTLLSNTGSCKTDELRELFGLVPCDDRELGETYIQSKNYGDAHSVKNQIDKETGSLITLAKAIKKFKNN